MERIRKKKLELLEKRKKRDALVRAKEVIKRKEVLSSDNNPEDKQTEPILRARKKILDFYKMGKFFNYRSKSCVETRNAEMQTEEVDLEKIAEMEKKKSTAKKKLQSFLGQSFLKKDKNKALFTVRSKPD